MTIPNRERIMKQVLKDASDTVELYRMPGRTQDPQATLARIIALLDHWHLKHALSESDDAERPERSDNERQIVMSLSRTGL